MTPANDHPAGFEFRPVTRENWADLAAFFAGHGNPNYCWCLRWRVSSKVFKNLPAKERCLYLEEMVQTSIPVGILAYFGLRPVGWCSIAPRESYQLLENSRTLKRIDDRPVWSVVCFFVDPEQRGQGLSLKLLQAAIAYALTQGAQIIEGYPVEFGRSYQFMGSPSIFEKAGFEVAALAKNGRLIMRYHTE